MAGIIGILRSSGIIGRAVKLAGTELTGKRTSAIDEPRTQRDLSMKFITLGVIVALVVTMLFFQFNVLFNWGHTLVSLLIVFIITFLFTTVAANAIAIVGSNPVSGMTLMTLLLTSVVLVGVGVSGKPGMTAAMILNKTYGFTGDQALVAPQANAMAAVIKPLMEGGNTPWILYGVGAILALILTSIGVPALPFALGMFIPLQLNTPLLIGGLVSWFVSTRSKDASVNKFRKERGKLIASGFIAGGALMGVVSAILKYMEFDAFAQEWHAMAGAEWLAIGMYALIILYFIVDSIRGKKHEA